MTLRNYLDESGLTPEVEGVIGLMDGHHRDELLSRMPANKIETRLQGALMEALYRWSNWAMWPCRSPTPRACS